MGIKKGLVLVLTLILTGCVSPPTTIDLQDQKGATVGKAFLLQRESFMTADHVFAINQPLFHNQKLIRVKERNRDRDTLIFGLPEDFVEGHKKTHFRKEPLEVGMNLYWSGGRGVITELGRSLQIGERAYEDLVIMTGAVVPGDSGAPVYDKKDRVVGLIIGGETGVIFLRHHR